MSTPYMGSYSSSFVITPSDSVNKHFSSLYIGGTGNVTIVDEGGGVTLISAIPVGTVLPCRGTRVNSTGTSATLIVGFD